MWHTIHAAPWFFRGNTQITTLLKAAEKLAPDSSRREIREPVTVMEINLIKAQMNLNDPAEAAIFACLTIGFYGLARLGELVTETQTETFNPGKHASIDNHSKSTDRNNHIVHSLHIPSTKTSIVAGQGLQWAKQNNASDPCEALENHIRINKPAPNEHLFSYGTRSKRVPLSRTKFINFISKIMKNLDLGTFNGHSLRIGGTLEYLLRGISFETVKIIGRWKSDAFHLYLREHAQILAPYLQAVPETLKEMSTILNNTPQTAR